MSISERSTPNISLATPRERDTTSIKPVIRDDQIVALVILIVSSLSVTLIGGVLIAVTGCLELLFIPIIFGPIFISAIIFLLYELIRLARHTSRPIPQPMPLDIIMAVPDILIG